MSEPETITIPVDTLREFLIRIFEAAGCDSENARLNAIGVVEADLHGHHIQGTDHIYSTVRELRAGHLNGRAKPKIVRETAATARVDGDGGTGHVTGLFATELAMRKAKEAGIGAVGLVGGGDIFMLGYYAERIAHGGLVGMVFTNTHPGARTSGRRYRPAARHQSRCLRFSGRGTGSHRHRLRNQHLGDRTCPHREL